MADDLQPIYDSAGNGQQLDPLFLKAQAIVESRQNPAAVSPKGAIGVSQFIPPTAAKAGVGQTPIDPADPQQAIPAQAAMMNGLIKKYTPANGQPDVNTALMEYHGGPDRSGWGPLTHAYPAKIAGVYAQLKQQEKANPVASPSTPAFDTLMSQNDSAPSAPLSPQAPGQPKVATSAFDALLAQSNSPTASISPSAQAAGGLPPAFSPAESASPPVAQASPINGPVGALASVGTNLAGKVVQGAKDAASAAPGVMADVGAGLVHGAQNSLINQTVQPLLNQGVNLLSKLPGPQIIDNLIPALKRLDERYSQGPSAADNAANEQAYQAKYGNLLAAKAGDVAGQVGMTLPVTAPLGALGGAAAVAGPRLVAPLVRLGTNALQGGVSAGMTGGDVGSGATAGGLAGAAGGLLGGVGKSMGEGGLMNKATGLLGAGIGLHLGDVNSALLGGGVGLALKEIAAKYGAPVAEKFAEFLKAGNNTGMLTGAAGLGGGQAGNLLQQPQR